MKPTSARLGREPPCPCRDCGQRSADCHAVCGAYAGWNAEHQRRKNERRKRQRGADDADAVLTGTSERIRKFMR